jgi:uncharacterized protein GlcG (DUF336 family)
LQEAPIVTRQLLIGLLAAFAALRLAPVPSAFAAEDLTAAEVDRIVTQAAAEAQRIGLRAFIAVTDTEGNVLASFYMTDAPFASVVAGTLGQGLEGRTLPANLVAITKAGSGAFLSSGSRAGGNAFSTRTASFIVQDHFPPTVDFTPGGPLFGVQFSSLPCTDMRLSLPLGLSGDPGGLPIYKDGVLAGGVGVEGDGRYGADTDPRTLDDADDAAAEEQAALAGTRGFEPPELIRANRILADGIRLPYVNVQMPPAAAAVPGLYLTGPRATPPSALVPATLGGVAGRADPRFPASGGLALTAADVTRILEQAARQAARTRAAIRQPLGSNARVSIAVVDLDGKELGFFQSAEAPNFGIDVSVQKARTANFFSSPTAADDLTRAGLTPYLRDGVRLDGSVAYTTRAIGFLSQPHYPPGIETTAEGPFSVPRARDEWSPFNTGLQLDIVSVGLDEQLLLGNIPFGCNFRLPKLPNGITIFPGGVPLFKDGRLAGAIGVSGDGVDQDDLIAWAGSIGFEAPADRRCDRLEVRGVRLPYVKFPRHPEL